MKQILRVRYWRIVFFFARVTLGIFFWDIILPRIGLRFLARNSRPRRLRQIAVRFRALAIRLGGVMIKVGQFLSARLDVLPVEITDELSGLQDEVPPVDFDEIRLQTDGKREANGSVTLVPQDESLRETDADEPLELRAWLPILEAGLGNLTVGVIPPALDQVLIGALDRGFLRAVAGVADGDLGIARARIHEHGRRRDEDRLDERRRRGQHRPGEDGDAQRGAERGGGHELRSYTVR